MRERSLVSRFARSAPTQATASTTPTVEILVVRDGHAALASTNRLDDDALRDTPRAAPRARAPRRGRPRRPGRGPPSRAARAPRAAPRSAAHDGFDAATARLDPAAAPAPRWPHAFAVAAEHGLEAFGIWTAGAVRTAIASSAGLRRDEEVTDAFMKVICRDAGGRSGFAAATAGGRRGDRRGRARPARRARRSATQPLAALGPGTYPVVLEADAVGALLEFLGGLAFNGLAHAEGRGALERPPRRRPSPRRRSTSPTTPSLRAHAAARLRRRGRAASRRCRSSRTASPARSCTTAAPPRSPAAARARPATPPAPGGSP